MLQLKYIEYCFYVLRFIRKLSFFDINRKKVSSLPKKIKKTSFARKQKEKLKKVE